MRFQNFENRPKFACQHGGLCRDSQRSSLEMLNQTSKKVILWQLLQVSWYSKAFSEEI